jgi:hypothetical protein
MSMDDDVKTWTAGETDQEHMTDPVDYDPDILAREARAPQQPPPEFEALQQMLNDAINREIVLRAEIVRLRRMLPGA